MDNQAKDLKLAKDKKKLSQMRKEKKCQKRARKCKEKRKEALEENRSPQKPNVWKFETSTFMWMVF